VFALVWLAVAAVGAMCCTMALRVFIDDEWEAGDWWAFDSWLLLRGVLFTFLFPVTRAAHTRRAERVNAALVMVWGALLLAGGAALAWYEATR